MIDRCWIGAIAGACLAATLACAPAHAAAPDPDKLAMAQKLFDEAVADLEAARYRSACPKLKRVVDMIPSGLGAMAALGDCYEQAGKLASAWKTFEVLEREAEKAYQRDRQQVAKKKLARLKPLIARIWLTIPDAVRRVPGLEIKCDGEPVDIADPDASVPVDGGHHVLVATAPGKRRWETALDVKEGVHTAIEIAALKDEPVATGPRAATAAAPPEEAPRKSAPLGTQRIAGLTVAGVGLAAIATGAVFGLQAVSLNNDSNGGGHCDENGYCDDTGFALRSQARGAGTVSTVMFVGGALAAAGGIALYFTKDGDWQVLTAAGPRGVSVQGAF